MSEEKAEGPLSHHEQAIRQLDATRYSGSDIIAYGLVRVALAIEDAGNYIGDNLRGRLDDVATAINELKVVMSRFQG